MKSTTELNSLWPWQAKRRGLNPLTSLRLEQLTAHLDAFERGMLREAAQIWEQLEQRDDLLRSVVSKRKKSVARHGWVVLPKEDLSPAQKEEAARHAEALEFFYANLECEHAVDTNERGGFRLLARQMMDAVGKRFAVHEIVWRVIHDGAEGKVGGPKLSAKFRFVPLSFFENTTGELRFLENQWGLEGRALEPGAWMITVGDGLMIATSLAWAVKNTTLRDWRNYSERTGLPVLRGSTPAARGSAEWDYFQAALVDLARGSTVLHGADDKVEVVDLGGTGTIPFPLLVERMDRMIAVLWRGADLSTLSRDRGYGASLQEKETCALEEDDAQMLTETLNRYVDQWVIRYLFGKKVEPLARVQVLVSPRECTTADLQVDQFRLEHGAPLEVEETMRRYGRKLPRAGSPLLKRGEAAESLPIEATPEMAGAE